LVKVHTNCFADFKYIVEVFYPASVFAILLLNFRLYFNRMFYTHVLTYALLMNE